MKKKKRYIFLGHRGEMHASIERAAKGGLDIDRHVMYTWLQPCVWKNLEEEAYFYSVSRPEWIDLVLEVLFDFYPLDEELERHEIDKDEAAGTLADLIDQHGIEELERLTPLLEHPQLRGVFFRAAGGYTLGKPVSPLLKPFIEEPNQLTNEELDDLAGVLLSADSEQGLPLLIQLRQNARDFEMKPCWFRPEVRTYHQLLDSYIKEVEEQEQNSGDG